MYTIDTRTPLRKRVSSKRHSTAGKMKAGLVVSKTADHPAGKTANNRNTLKIPYPGYRKLNKFVNIIIKNELKIHF